MNIEYSVTDEEGIDIVAPLWEKLNEHHGSISPISAMIFRAEPGRKGREDYSLKPPTCVSILPGIPVQEKWWGTV
jgi:hypothetical protein